MKSLLPPIDMDERREVAIGRRKTVFNDDDGVLNPGETAYLVVNLENEIGWTEATSLEGLLSSSKSSLTKKVKP